MMLPRFVVCFLSLQLCSVEEIDWVYVETTLELELGPQPCRTNYHQRKVFRAVKFFPESLYSERLHGLDGPGIASQWGRGRFSPLEPWGSTDVLCNEYQVSFSGVKRPGLGVHHPPPPSAEVKERVELYLYSTLGPQGLWQSQLYVYYTLNCTRQNHVCVPDRRRWIQPSVTWPFTDIIPFDVKPLIEWDQAVYLKVRLPREFGYEHCFYGFLCFPRC
jgi:hypothetical protein